MAAIIVIPAPHLLLRKEFISLIAALFCHSFYIKPQPI